MFPCVNEPQLLFLAGCAVGLVDCEDGCFFGNYGEFNCFGPWIIKAELDEQLGNWETRKLGDCNPTDGESPASPAPPAETDGVSQFCLRHSDVISTTCVGCLCRVFVRPHPVRTVHRPHRSRVYCVVSIWFLVNVIAYDIALIITTYEVCVSYYHENCTYINKTHHKWCPMILNLGGKWDENPTSNSFLFSNLNDIPIQS